MLVRHFVPPTKHVNKMAAMDDVQVQEEYDEFRNEDDAVTRLKQSATRKKGRGFDDRGDMMDTDAFDSVAAEGGQGPLRSVEGWIVFITGVHEEAQEDDVYDKFAEYGDIKNIHVNLDRRTGYLKGYALVEYETLKEAQAAIDKLNGADILGQRIHVDWAFVKPPAGGRGRRDRR